MQFPCIDSNGLCRREEWCDDDLTNDFNITNRTAFNYNQSEPLGQFQPLSPNVAQFFQRRLQSSGSSADGDAIASGQAVAPNGCRSGMATGILAVDRSRCVIVALELPSNGLNGPLAATDPTSGTILEAENVTASGQRFSNVLCDLPFLQVLSLSRNNLVGPLPDDVSVDRASVFNASESESEGTSRRRSMRHLQELSGECLPMLRHIDIEDNVFNGTLPGFLASPQIRVARLGSVDLLKPKPKGNNFAYPPDRETETNREALVNLETIFFQCDLKFDQDLRTGCTGVPGSGDRPSCDAFGGKAVLWVPRNSARSRFRCDECPNDYWSLIGFAIGIFTVMLLMLSAYAVLVARKSTATQMWISSFSIVWYHAATLSIIGSLKLNWPPSVKFFTSSLSVSFFGVDFVNPQCLLRVMGPYAMQYFNIGRILMLLALLFSPSVFHLFALVCLRGDAREELRHKWCDRFEFLQSIVFAMQLTASFKVCIAFITQYAGLSSDTSNDQVARLGELGITTVGVLLVLEVIVVTKYCVSMFMLKNVGSFELIGLTPNRLRRRMAYMTNRYAEHAQHHWQFAVWMRLLLLTLATQSPDIVSMVQRTMRGDTPQTADEILSESETDEAVRWAHASAAIVLLAIFGVWHHRTQPFRFKFQNVVETSLFFADVLTITLACLYTVALPSSGKTGIGTFILEALLFAVVAGSLTIAMIIVVRRWHMDRLARHKAKAEDDAKDVYRSGGRAEIAGQNMWRLGKHNQKVAVRQRNESQEGRMRADSMGGDRKAPLGRGATQNLGAGSASNVSGGLGRQQTGALGGSGSGGSDGATSPPNSAPKRRLGPGWLRKAANSGQPGASSPSQVNACSSSGSVDAGGISLRVSRIAARSRQSTMMKGVSGKFSRRSTMGMSRRSPGTSVAGPADPVSPPGMGSAANSRWGKAARGVRSAGRMARCPSTLEGVSEVPGGPSGGGMPSGGPGGNRAVRPPPATRETSFSQGGRKLHSEHI